MEFEQLVSIAEIVGGFTVLATLVYLLYELKQNTKLLKAKVNTAAYLGWADFNVALSEHPDKVVIARAFDPNELLDNFNSSEHVTISSLGRAMIQRFSAAHFQYKSGLLDKELWVANATYCHSIFSLPVWESWWLEERKMPIYSKEFIESINDSATLSVYMGDSAEKLKWSWRN